MNSFEKTMRMKNNSKATRLVQDACKNTAKEIAELLKRKSANHMSVIVDEEDGVAFCILYATSLAAMIQHTTEKYVHEIVCMAISDDAPKPTIEAVRQQIELASALCEFTKESSQ